MKYIRTESGHIYDISKYQLYDAEDEYQGDGIGRYNYETIIAQADTVDELCDEFVVHTWEDGKKVCNSLDFVEIIYMNNKNYDEIYGAIWTDKGLIYVAKMNDEGVLKLI